MICSIFGISNSIKMKYAYTPVGLLMTSLQLLCHCATTGHAVKQECSISTQENQIVADCFHLKLVDLPLDLPHNTTHLILKDNRLRNIAPRAFTNTPYLQYLDLSDNKFERLHVDTFVGLHNLSYLNLDYNTAMCLDYKAFPVGLFKDNQDLKILKIYSYKFCRYEYPEKTFHNLKMLEELTIPFAQDPYFGEGFSKLTSLKKLTISKEACIIKKIDYNVFENLINLTIQELVIINCDLRNIDHRAFIYFSHLHTLNLACNRFLNIADTMVAIKNIPSQIDTLVLDGLFTRTSSSFVEFTPDLMCGKSLNKLRRLSYRAIPSALHVKAVNCLWNLEQLNIGFSLFVGNKNFNTFEFLHFRSTSLIKVLDISYLGHAATGLHRRRVCQSHDFSTTEEFFRHPPEYILNYTVHEDGLNHIPTGFVSYLPIATAAVYLDHADYSYQYSEFYSRNPSKEYFNIHLLNISHILWPCLCSDLRRVVGLGNLIILDGSYGEIETIDLTGNLTGLRELYIHNNRLALSKKPLKYLFDQMPNLHILDMSDNGLSELKDDTFISLVHLKKLMLRNNMLAFIYIPVHLLSKLSLIDLSHNDIGYLEKRMLDTLDRESISLNLEDNPLDCYCFRAPQSVILPFMLWLKTTGVQFINPAEYMCTDTKEVRVWSVPILHVEEHCLMRSLMHQDDDHSKGVINKYHIITIVVNMILLVLMILIYVNKWKLRYWHHLVRYRGLKCNLCHDQDEENVFDVFILCTEVSRDWDDLHWVVQELLPRLEEWQLRTCLEGRDFMVGVPRVDALVEAIDKSDKTLIVLSSDFTQDDYCMFGLRMAMVKGLGHVIFCKLEIPLEGMEPFLIRALDSAPCVTFNGRKQDTFWRRLHDVLT